eukprot:1561161-Prymnesium_polylepis.1
MIPTQNDTAACTCRWMGPMVPFRAGAQHIVTKAKPKAPNMHGRAGAHFSQSVPRLKKRFSPCAYVAALAEARTEGRQIDACPAAF